MKVYRIKDQNISYKREQNFFFMKDGLCPLEVFAARSRRDLRKPCFAALSMTTSQSVTYLRGSFKFHGLHQSVNAQYIMIIDI